MPLNNTHRHIFSDNNTIDKEDRCLFSLLIAAVILLIILVLYLVHLCATTSNTTTVKYPYPIDFELFANNTKIFNSTN